MIGLMDCNAMYVSCERVFRPDLDGRPVGVLTNNDGCVIARSDELKALGIDMGMPAHQIPPDLRRKITLLSSNYALYGDLSRRVMSTLSRYTPDIEPYSIDESFLGFDGFPLENLEAHCQSMRHQVRKETGIPVSLGLSASRTLAKVANRVAKKVSAYEGVCMLSPDSEVTRRILETTPVTDLWGVARRTGLKLADLNIHSAWDLREANPKRLRRLFNVNLERAIWELRGVDCIELDAMTVPKQQIMTSRSFGRLTGDPADLREAVRHHASRGAEKLRKQRSLASALLVFLKTNPYRPELPQHSESVLLPLPSPTDDSRLIVRTASQGLSALYTRGFLYQKAGVMLTDLTDREHEQLDMLANQQSDEERKRSERLMATLDQLNRELGAGTIKLGGGRKNAAWHLRCAYRSPRYTTRWDELPIVRTG